MEFIIFRGDGDGEISLSFGLFEWTACRKGGSQFPIEVVVAEIQTKIVKHDLEQRREVQTSVLMIVRGISDLN